ncbi:MAG TPA: ABC transporter permease [Blastocatellia bacterium]|nr:ABC transporter permease [Blastocatellia bacterium]
METLLHDVRFALRQLRKRPGFTAIAVIALALGIGANSAIFSVVNAVLLRPLPYPQPEQLMRVWETRRQQGFNLTSVSPAEFIAWREQSKSFAHLVAMNYANVNLTGGDTPEQIPGLQVSADYFEMLGVRAALGRTFLAEEDQPERSHVVVLSHGLWQRRFGGNPNIVGQRVMLGGVSHEIIGVMPRDFQFTDGTQLAQPIAFRPDRRTDFGTHFFEIQARLRPGVTARQAQAELSAIARGIEQAQPQTNAGHGIQLVPLHEQMVSDSRTALLILMGAVGLVLLIACANVANLLLARAASRQREVAIRLAMGATRWRLVRQLLTESVILSVMGAVIGVTLAWWGVDALVAAAKDSLPRYEEIRLDASVLGFTMALALATGLLFGLAPALQASKPQLGETLKEGGKGSTEGSGRNRVRSLLVVSEVALTLILLAGAGLLTKSFLQLRNVNPGFRADHLLVLDVVLPKLKYAEKNQIAGFFEQALARIAALPGVESVGATDALPLSGNNISGSFTIEGRPPADPANRPNANRRSVSPDYFRAMGITLVKGRAFTEQDTTESQPVVIINETMAKRFWPNEEVIGKRLKRGSADDNTSPWLEVVGVVNDVKHSALNKPARQEMYLPFTQAPSNYMAFAVRTPGDPAKLVPAVRDAVFSVDKDQPVGSVGTMEELMAQSAAPWRLAMQTLGLFAALAMLLASVGLYGVMAYSVAQRTHEIGIRMALGARAPDVMKLVVSHGMKLVVSGVMIGMAGSFALTRLMKNLLFGVSPTDPLTFVTVPLVLAVVALVACYLPARRATKTDPMIALRYE